MKVDGLSEQQIRHRAYDIYVQQGCRPGHDLDHWLQAEYELTQLPIRTIAKLERPKSKHGKAIGASLISLVQAALQV
jgi:hypothetical protein